MPYSRISRDIQSVCRIGDRLVPEAIRREKQRATHGVHVRINNTGSVTQERRNTPSACTVVSEFNCLTAHTV